MRQCDATIDLLYNRCCSLLPTFHGPLILPNCVSVKSSVFASLVFFSCTQMILVLLTKRDSGELRGPATALIQFPYLLIPYSQLDAYLAAG